MRARKNGEETRQRILEAACEVFGEKGYRDATHTAICERAGVNIAAINYHFGAKETLYRAACQHLLETAEALYPLDGGVPPEAPAEARLQAFIEALLQRRLDPERLGRLHRIHMAEMFDPTGLLDEMMAQWLAKNRAHLEGILEELLGPHTPPRTLGLCEMSIVSQCLMGPPGRPHARPQPMLGLGAADVAHLADHIVRFSLAGIEAVRREMQRKAT
ncbi:MAG TPA: CerR family C-terminal domain-containing protein [Candidatus Hydrogenedentes bacterium]|nr:CerR family C-terminal domain-containing protein [Candidatus Hydrogenedentota bacterium]